MSREIESKDVSSSEAHKSIHHEMHRMYTHGISLTQNDINSAIHTNYPHLNWHWFEDHFEPVIEVDDPNKLLTMNGEIIKKCQTCFRNKKQIINEGLQGKEVLYLIKMSIKYFIQYKAEYQHKCSYQKECIKLKKRYNDLKKKYKESLINYDSLSDKYSSDVTIKTAPVINNFNVNGLRNENKVLKSKAVKILQKYDNELKKNNLLKEKITKLNLQISNLKTQINQLRIDMHYLQNTSNNNNNNSSRKSIKLNNNGNNNNNINISLNGNININNTNNNHHRTEIKSDTKSFSNSKQRIVTIKRSTNVLDVPQSNNNKSSSPSTTYDIYDDSKTEQELNNKKIEEFTNLNIEINRELQKMNIISNNNNNNGYKIDNEFLIKLFHGFNEMYKTWELQFQHPLLKQIKSHTNRSSDVV